jgi:hypothetical protein
MVGVGRGRGVEVGVGRGVAVGTGVAVAAGVGVGCGVGVGVGRGVEVGSGVLVAVGGGVSVGIAGGVAALEQPVAASKRTMLNALVILRRREIRNFTSRNVAAIMNRGSTETTSGRCYSEMLLQDKRGEMR